MQRLIATYYNGGERVAKSVTIKGAAKAAFFRLLTGEYKHATIYDQDNNITVTLERTRRGIDVLVKDWTQVNPIVGMSLRDIPRMTARH